MRGFCKYIVLVYCKGSNATLNHLGIPSTSEVPFIVSNAPLNASRSNAVALKQNNKKR